MSDTSAHAIIIEDEPANRDSFARALSRIGWKVATFAEAEPGLD